MRLPAHARIGSLDLSGKRVLIVEDEFFMADEMAHGFRSYGAEIVGPVPSLSAAMRAIADVRSLDGAVLDISLLGEMVFPLVDTLRQREVRCVFSTGYDRGVVPTAYENIPLFQKPVETADLAVALFD